MTALPDRSISTAASLEHAERWCEVRNVPLSLMAAVRDAKHHFGKPQLSDQDLVDITECVRVALANMAQPKYRTDREIPIAARLEDLHHRLLAAGIPPHDPNARLEDNNPQGETP